MTKNNINKFNKGSLVIYHNSPVIITDIIADKISIVLKNKKIKKVREKDIIFLHSGPIKNLKDLDAKLDGDIESALELLEGEAVDIMDLADFIYGESSAIAVWKTWEILQDAIYFSGTTEEIIPNTQEFIENIIKERNEKQKEKLEWETYIKRVKTNAVIEEDLSKLKEIEILAFGKELNSKTMRAMNLESSPQKAHQLLLSLDLWDDTVNPYPARFDCNLKNPEFEIPKLPKEERKDLTHLKTYAIDSEHTNDPDDAISLDGDYLWIHIADVAALITPNSDMDMESRGRGSTLYLPERSVNMIPKEMVKTLGLGLQETSPALSFKIKVNEEGEPICEEITPSLIKVKRISYNKVDNLMTEEPFLSINTLIKKFSKRRRDNGVIDIILPEADISVKPTSPLKGEFSNDSAPRSSREFEISISKVEMTKSREMVMDAMLLTGEAVADWLLKNNIPAPYASQVASDETKQPETPSQTLAYLKTLQKSKLSLVPGIHAGLGLEKYVRVTSPLRRYSDLLVHQQIRAFLANKELINASEMESRMTEADFTASNRTKASRLSSKHWKLYYIKHISNKKFTGILMDKRGNAGIVSIPELAIDAKVQGVGGIDLDTELKLKVSDVNISKLELYVRVVK